MMWLKACPRCNKGDMYQDEDNLKHCMQCGFIQGSVDGTTAQLALARLLDSRPVEKVERAEAVAV